MIPFDIIRDAIADATGLRPDEAPVPVGGGCINATHRLGDFFVKTGDASRLPMFDSERQGLEAIAATGTIRVPAAICCAVHGDHAFLVLEHLALTRGDGTTQEELGRSLAAMHRTTRETFGWHLDNFIGATPQPNAPTTEWIPFLRDQRLGHMLTLAAGCGYRFRNAGILLDHLDVFFGGYAPTPSLLHGDLWGGNSAALPDGSPVIFDPAVYFGDREADLAMATLFGGFSRTFHDAYHEACPPAPGQARRVPLYNLYHILNHAILFGGSYASQAQSMIDRLVAGI